MKTVTEYLELVEETLPCLKASDRLYVIGLLQDAYKEGLDDMLIIANKNIYEVLKDDTVEF